MMEQNARRVGRQAPETPTPNQKQPGNDDETESQKTRETSPGTLSRTRWNQEMMTEQNAKRAGRQAPEPYPEPKDHDGTKTVSWKNWKPRSAPELFGELRWKLAPQKWSSEDVRSIWNTLKLETPL